jgi:SARP family transcriptional regulator, regulator of embCAB operon
LYVQILGPVRLQHGARAVSPTPRLARVLLGILALRANAELSVDWLRYALWADSAPKSAAANLRGYLAELRRLLLTAGPAGVRIETSPSGYCLRAVPEALDVLLFDSLVADGRRLLNGGHHQAAADRLTRALVLWRGPVLEGIQIPEPIQPEVQVLEVKRLDAIEDSVEARLALGRHRELVAELTLFLAQWPLRERLAGQLMLALCRSGRQVEALSVYQSMRARLDEELGVVPNAELQQLHRRVLQADPSLQFGEPGRPRLVS